MAIPDSLLGLTILLSLLLTTSASLGWQADNGDGTYKNPILWADYSDPDIVRHGSDFYMVASSFFYMPGIPVLHSKDLVNWTLIGHVFPRLDLDKKFDLQGGAKYGHGCWAPSIRFHDGRFYVYFCTPDEGLFMSSAANPAGPWAPLTQVKKVAGWEDPCPFWDDDGKAYLVHSRLGGGMLILHRMSPDGKRLLDDGKTIIEGKDKYGPLEGPKFLKRHGYYYILAPAGGVEMGYQMAFRAKDIYGPYEAKRVLEQGSTKINGPHQGGLVELDSGQSWFVHFRQLGAYGRIVYLEPVHWVDDWPLMGVDYDGNGVGEPVPGGKKPDVGRSYPIAVPATSDEFNSPKLGLQWQWNHNPLDDHWSLSAHPGFLRLIPAPAGSLADARNTLTQKIADPACMATTELHVGQMRDNELAGLTVFGDSRGWIGVRQEHGHRQIVMADNRGGWRGKGQHFEAPGPILTGEKVYLRAIVRTDQTAAFLYSLDGVTYESLGERVKLYFDWWKGSKLGLFCYTTDRDKDTRPGYAEFNWFHYEPVHTGR